MRGINRVVSRIKAFNVNDFFTFQTTTIEPPTTTPTPNPTPSEPEAANWTLTDGNQTCIMLRIATQLNVSYTTVGKLFIQTLQRNVC